MSTVRRRSLAVAALVAALAVAPATTALAAGDTGGRIDHVEDSDGSVELLFSVPGVGPDASPDPDSIAVTVDGVKVEAEASAVSESDAVRRTAVLAIDVSNSMVGKAFESAKQAALTYIDSAPANVDIGIVTFATSVETVQEPTDDREALASTIESLELSSRTQLYDGVLEALEVAAVEGSSTVLLLSDGKDTSATELAEVVAAAEEAGARIDVMALNQTVTARSPLAQIAAASKGSVTTTSDPKQLEAFFAQQADVLAKQLVVTFPLPEGYQGGESNLSVSVTAGGRSVSDDAFVTLGAAASTGDTTTASVGAGLGKNWLFGGLGAIFLGLGGLLVYAMTRMAPAPESELQKQLAMYTVDGMKRAAPAEGAEGSSLKDSAVSLAHGLVKKRDLEEMLAAKLEAAGLGLRAAEWLLLHIGIAIAAGLTGMLLSGGGIVLTVVGLKAGLILPWTFLKFKEGRRIKAFNGQLAQTLQIMAGGLQAGLSLPQAVDTVVQEGSEPVSEEFRRALVQQRLGVDVEDTLETVAERMKSVDFKWVVMAIRIQREVGGNLSELLLTVAATLREREYLRRQVATLSAEGRLSAWILGGLPPGFVLYLMVARPTYLDPMISNKIGWLMFGAAGVSMAVGSFWLKKTVKVEV